jgi:serine/threonine protein kinase
MCCWAWTAVILHIRAALNRCAGQPGDPRAKINCIQRIRAGQLVDPRLPLHLSPELQHLLRACLARDPAQRITTAELCEHPWVHQAPPVADAGGVRQDRDWSVPRCLPVELCRR